MCTVVVRWAPGTPVLVLALRDELVGRDFDDPRPWWPLQPTAIGGRDRTAGGSWCVSDVATGATALVLNRPQRRFAAAGAPSRGVLPLLAVQHGRDWPAQLDTAGMASFAVVLATPGELALWAFDGEVLTDTELPTGTHMVTSGGAEDGKADRYLADFAAAGDAEQWQALVTGRTPQDDPAALVVRHQAEDLIFATVFGQVITASPGSLSLGYSRTPWQAGTWRTERWPQG
jgi:hypothetical protein